MNKLNRNNQQKIDSIAEQWVNIVLSHIRAKKLLNKSSRQRDLTKKCYGKCK